MINIGDTNAIASKSGFLKQVSISLRQLIFTCQYKSIKFKGVVYLSRLFLRGFFSLLDFFFSGRGGRAMLILK